MGLKNGDGERKSHDFTRLMQLGGEKATPIGCPSYYPKMGAYFLSTHHVPPTTNSRLSGIETKEKIRSKVMSAMRCHPEDCWRA